MLKQASAPATNLEPTTPVLSRPKGSRGSVRRDHSVTQFDAVDLPLKEGVGARETASNRNLFAGRGRLGGWVSIPA